MTYNAKHPAQLIQELDPVLSYVCMRAGLPSLSVDINIAGEPVSLAFRDGIGRIVDGERPLYAVGCVLDMLFAVICVDLHHRLGLGLDEPFEQHIPELAPLVRRDHADPITIQHLLTRTSGIQEPRTIDEMRQFIPWEDLSPRIRDAPRLFSPGSAFNYGGIDRLLLAIVMERFSGKSIGKLAREIVVQPCGIQHRPEQFGAPDDTGFQAVERCDTAHLAQTAASLGIGGVDGLHTPFSEAVRTHLQLEKIPISRSVKAPPWPHAATAFTLGLFKYSDGLVGFNGWDSGQSCSVRYDPVSQLGFAVAMDGPPGVRDYVVAEVAQRLGYFSVQSRAVPCTVGGLNGLRPDDIVGDYSGWAAGYRADVTLEHNVVACDLSYESRRFRRMRMRMEDEAWLVVDSAAELSSLEFFRDPRTGRVCMASGGVPYAMTTSNLNA
ncbi:MAG: serine hydrolase domain-containing protein [Phenylobacterium sp.]